MPGWPWVSPPWRPPSQAEPMQGLIGSGLAELGLSGQVPEGTAAHLAQFGQLLLRKNEVMNLTAIIRPRDVATLHMLDCAALLNCAGFQYKTLIDVGTGAGFPGIPLKILVPTLYVTLLDTQGKRVDWLEEACDALGLDGVAPIQGRAEEAAHLPALRGQYDFATARAVADLRILSELCLPFVKVGGYFLAMKGTDCDAELEAARPAIHELGGEVEQCVDYAIPHTVVSHRVVMVKKKASTPSQYPRKWVKIQKNPL